MFSLLLNSILFAIEITLPSILLLVFGFFLKKNNQVSSTFIVESSYFIFKWCLPSLLFINIVASDFSIMEYKNIILLGISITFFLFFLAELLAKLFIKKRKHRGLFVQGIFRGNLAILGLSFAQNAYGNKGLLIASIYAGIITIIYNILAVITLTNSLTTKKVNFRQILKKIITNPLIIGISLAIMVNLLEFKIHEPIFRSIQYLANISIPVALICIGASFDFKNIFNAADLSLITSLVRLLIVPIIVLLLGIYFIDNKTTLGIFILMNLTPVATASFIMVKAMGGDEKISANIIALTTLGSMIITPVIITILKFMNII